MKIDLRERHIRAAVIIQAVCLSAVHVRVNAEQRQRTFLAKQSQLSLTAHRTLACFNEFQGMKYGSHCLLTIFSCGPRILRSFDMTHMRLCALLCLTLK